MKRFPRSIEDEIECLLQNVDIAINLLMHHKEITISDYPHIFYKNQYLFELYEQHGDKILKECVIQYLEKDIKIQESLIEELTQDDCYVSDHEKMDIVKKEFIIVGKRKKIKIILESLEKLKKIH